MLKSKLMPTIVLSAICICVVAVLAVVNIFTTPVIKANQDAKAQEALLEVMPDGVSFDEVTNFSELPAEVTAAYKSANGGYVFQMSVTGYKTGLIIMCGVDADGNITGAKYIQSNETLGAENELGAKYIGTNISDYESVDTISGATLTCKGYKQAISAALKSFEILKGGEK